MKHVRFMFIALFAISFSPIMAQQSSNGQTDSIRVNGACGMCKSRIQKAIKIDGVTEATWNKETKVLLVSYNPDVISNDVIQKKIAFAGHDTEKYRAEDSIYEKLPGCCHYDRETEGQSIAATNMTESIHVNGACGMCKNRIQKAVKMEGVSEAGWDKETKVLSISYNPDIITNDAIQKKIASVGHDTEKYKADDKIYEKLPGCCHYDRTKQLMGGKK